MAFVSASWPSSVGSRLRAIASRWISKSGKLPSTESRNARTSWGRSGSRSAPPASSASPRNSISLPGPYGLDGVLPRALLAELFYLPLVLHRRVGRSYRPVQDEPEVGLVHVPVGDPGAGGLGRRLPVQGVLSPPSELFQIDLQHIGEELGRLGVATAPARLDLLEVVAGQSRPSGEFLLAEPLAQPPVLEAWERQASTPERRFRLTNRAIPTRKFLGITSHASNLLPL